MQIGSFTFFALLLGPAPAPTQGFVAFIAADASPGAKQLWDLLNSSFALWFLSSVVLATITGLYTRYRKNESERAERATVQKRLNTEISSRIADGLVALRLETKRVGANTNVYFASAMYNEAIYYLNNRVTDNDRNPLDFSVYPEYKHRRFRSLLYELSAVVEPATSHALHDANEAYTELEKLADQTPLEENYSAPPDREKCLAAIATSCELLERLEKHSFWRARL